MSEARRIGLALGSQAVWAVLVRSEVGAPVVEKIVELQLPQPVGPETLTDPSKSEEVREAIATRFDDIVQGESESVVAVPASFCRVRIVPMDGELQGEEIQEQARWELAQAIVDDPGNYNFGAERLNAEIGLADRLVVAALHKTLARGVRRIFDGVAGRLIAIEADVFSAIRAFERNYEADPVRPIFLLGRFDGAFHAVVLNKKLLASYGVWPLTESVANEVSNIAAFVRDAIDRFGKAHDIFANLEEVAGIYLYGEAVEEDLLEALRDTCESRVERLNPFQRFRPLEGEVGELTTEMHPEAYAAAFGAALW